MDYWGGGGGGGGQARTCICVQSVRQTRGIRGMPPREICNLVESVIFHTNIISQAPPSFSSLAVW